MKAVVGLQQGLVTTGECYSTGSAIRNPSVTATDFIVASRVVTRDG